MSNPTATHVQPDSELQLSDLREPAVCFRLPILLLVLFAGGLLFLKLLPNDPVLHSALRRAIQSYGIASRAESDSKAADPQPGMVLPLPVVQRDSGLVNLAGGTEPNRESHFKIVLMMGPCSSCVLATLREIAGLEAEYPWVEVVAVSPSPEGELDHFRKMNGVEIPLISDQTGRLGSAYNATWSPRAYILTDAGKLLWVQERGRLDLAQLREMVSDQAVRSEEIE